LLTMGCELISATFPSGTNTRDVFAIREPESLSASTRAAWFLSRRAVALRTLPPRVHYGLLRLRRMAFAASSYEQCLRQGDSFRARFPNELRSARPDRLEVQSMAPIVHQPCWKRCPECNAKLSTRQIRALMTRSPWRMFATYVKGGSDRSANAASYSYVLHAPEGPSISVMRSENE